MITIICYNWIVWFDCKHTLHTGVLYSFKGYHFLIYHVPMHGARVVP